MPENLMDPITGLSDSKLSQATASSSDVLSGKTFYSGDKTLKSGTFNLGIATAIASDVLSGKTFYAENSTLKTGTLVNIKTRYVVVGIVGPNDSLRPSIMIFKSDSSGASVQTSCNYATGTFFSIFTVSSDNQGVYFTCTKALRCKSISYYYRDRFGSNPTGMTVGSKITVGRKYNAVTEAVYSGYPQNSVCVSILEDEG